MNEAAAMLAEVLDAVEEFLGAESSSERFADSSRWWDRPLSRSEQRYLMSGSADGLDAILARAQRQADEQYLKAIRKLEREVSEWIAAPNVTPRGILSKISKAGLDLDGFEDTLVDTSMQARKFGIEQAAREIRIAGGPPVVKLPPDVTQSRARFDAAGQLAPVDPYQLWNFEALTRARSFQVRAGYEQKALQAIAGVLANLNQQGINGPEATERLAAVFNDLAAGGIITPGKSKMDFTKQAVQDTTIRTMAASAFNAARQDVYERNDSFVLGYKISEVANGRDTNSHPFSKHLDGLRIKIGDPRGRMLVPPNHYNDRAVQVAETVLDEPIEWSSDAEIDQALEWKRQLSPNFT